MELLIQLGLTVGLLLITWFIGSRIEKKHFERIREREAIYRRYPVITIKEIPQNWADKVEATELAQGNVVVSVDYFKRFLAGLRAFIGGRIKSYEPILDRARREAVLRMAEKAIGDGYDAVINVRVETSRLASSRNNGQGTAGVEMLAYGTAIRFRKG